MLSSPIHKDTHYRWHASYLNTIIILLYQEFSKLERPNIREEVLWKELSKNKTTYVDETVVCYDGGNWGDVPPPPPKNWGDIPPREYLEYVPSSGKICEIKLPFLQSAFLDQLPEINTWNQLPEINHLKSTMWNHLPEKIFWNELPEINQFKSNTWKELNTLNQPPKIYYLKSTTLNQILVINYLKSTHLKSPTWNQLLKINYLKSTI